jgi:hypothetical protein
MAMRFANHFGKSWAAATKAQHGFAKFPPSAPKFRGSLMTKVVLSALAICGAICGIPAAAQAADYAGAYAAPGTVPDEYCDCPDLANLHRPFYCKHHVVYLPHNPEQPYLVRVYYTPAVQPYYNEPRTVEYVPYFGPLH